MGKRKKYRTSNYTQIEINLLDSEAYMRLSGSAAKALPIFFSKVWIPIHDPNRYLKVFTFSYGEAKKYGFANSTFRKAINELHALGFIEIVAKGGLRSDGLGYNKFKLSNRWRNLISAEKGQDETSKNSI